MANGINPIHTVIKFVNERQHLACFTETNTFIIRIYTGVLLIFTFCIEMEKKIARMCVLKTENLMFITC